MIQVANLTKSFGRHRVLRGLSFRVGAGEFVVVLGPSGAGKSTLLRCLNGLVQPSLGSVAVAGSVVDRRTLGAVRKQVGFIFQGANVHGSLTVLQNVLIGRLAEKSPWSILFSKEDRSVAREAIERVGLGEKTFARTSTLSGGQRQRVGIARALALRFMTRLLILVANSRRPPISRSLGKIGFPGGRYPRHPASRLNSPPVSMLGLGLNARQHRDACNLLLNRAVELLSLLSVLPDFSGTATSRWVR
jgi:ABC-type lipoprotein export system ATPase subunit